MTGMLPAIEPQRLASISDQRIDSPRGDHRAFREALTQAQKRQRSRSTYSNGPTSRPSTSPGTNRERAKAGTGVKDGGHLPGGDASIRNTVGNASESLSEILATAPDHGIASFQTSAQSEGSVEATEPGEGPFSSSSAHRFSQGIGGAFASSIGSVGTQETVASGQSVPAGVAQDEDGVGTESAGTRPGPLTLAKEAQMLVREADSRSSEAAVGSIGRDLSELSHTLGSRGDGRFTGDLVSVGTASYGTFRTSGDGTGVAGKTGRVPPTDHFGHPGRMTGSAHIAAVDQGEQGSHTGLREHPWFRQLSADGEGMSRLSHWDGNTGSHSNVVSAQWNPGEGALLGEDSVDRMDSPPLWEDHPVNGNLDETLLFEHRGLQSAGKGHAGGAGSSGAAAFFGDSVYASDPAHEAGGSGEFPVQPDDGESVSQSGASIAEESVREEPVDPTGLARQESVNGEPEGQVLERTPIDGRQENGALLATAQNDQTQPQAVSEPGVDGRDAFPIDARRFADIARGTLEQMVRRVEGEIDGENASLKMQLNPGRLGDLELKLELDRGVLTARFVAASEEVKAMIESALPDLKRHLADQGVAVEELSVFVGQREGEEATGQREGWERHGAGPSRSLGRGTSAQYEATPDRLSSTLGATGVDVVV